MLVELFPCIVFKKNAALYVVVQDTNMASNVEKDK